MNTVLFLGESPKTRVNICIYAAYSWWRRSRDGADFLKVGQLLQRVSSGYGGSTNESRGQGVLLGEVTSRQRSEGRRGLARQREEAAMVFHAQNILGLGAEVRSSMRKVWKVGKGSWGKGLACCLKKFGLGLEGNRELGRVLKRAHLEQLLWLHYREWSIIGNAGWGK